MVYVGSASIDENGKAYEGKAGNQSGKELRKQAWYKHSKGWRVFRAKDQTQADMIANDMIYAIDNKNIGYDQYQRNTLYNAASKVGFNCSKVTTLCETDCSALVRVCCAYAGISLPASFRTVNEPSVLLATGKFIELKGKLYTDQSAYLRKGDILVTATSGHTVVVLNDGDKADYENKDDDTGGDKVNVELTVLRKGAKGAEVKTLQRLLIAGGYDLGKYGADGDFGKGTETAVKAFQKSGNLESDGIVGKNTWTKLLKG